MCQVNHFTHLTRQADKAAGAATLVAAPRKDCRF